MVPKERVYAAGGASTALRERFVAEVQKITWAYKLAESTINLAGSSEVPEVQVFEIEAKGSDVSDTVLAAIDTAVKTPIIFEITGTVGDARRVRIAASTKPAGASVKKAAYRSSGWVAAETARSPLPAAVDLPALHAAVLTPLMPVTARPNERLSEVSARVSTAQRLEREITALQRKIRTEPQLNRKVELRRALRQKQSQLEELK
jgi:hypothetical protein